MAAIPLVYGGAQRRYGAYQEIRQRNCFAEEKLGDPEKGFALLCRPGLTNFATSASGGRRGIFQRTDLWSSDAILVAGATASRLSASGVVTNFTGTVGGTSSVRIALGRNDAAEDVARIATGDGLYLLAGTTVTAEDFPEAGGAGAQDVESLRDFWFALEAGTDKFYFKIPGDASPWAALDYATNEYKPDRGVAVRSLGDQLYFLNSNSTEGWGLTGDASVIAPLGGLKFDFGCAARDTAIVCDDELVFVDSNFEVRLTNGGYPAVISDTGLAEEIRSADRTSLRAWFFRLDGHRFYILSLGALGTRVCDLSTKLWHPWTSDGYDYWRADMGCALGDRVVTMDRLSPAIWQVNPDAFGDVSDPITCLFTAYAPVGEGEVSCDNLEIDAAVGGADPGDDPKVSMRYSDDERHTWSPWRERSLGERGRYGTTLRWNQLGTIRAPKGRHFEFRCTDGIRRRFSNPKINVP